MGIYEIFLKRQKRLRGEMPDVYVYVRFPSSSGYKSFTSGTTPLETRTIVSRRYAGTRGAYKFIVEQLCREYGIFTLHDFNSRRGERSS